MDKASIATPPVVLDTNMISLSTPGKTIHAIKFLYIVAAIGVFSTFVVLAVAFIIFKMKPKKPYALSFLMLLSTGVAFYCMRYYLKYYAIVKGAYNKIYVQRRFGSTVTIVQGLNSGVINQYNDLVRAGKR